MLAILWIHLSTKLSNITRLSHDNPTVFVCLYQLEVWISTFHVTKWARSDTLLMYIGLLEPQYHVACNHNKINKCEECRHSLFLFTDAMAKWKRKTAFWFDITDENFLAQSQNCVTRQQNDSNASKLIGAPKPLLITLYRFT